MCFLCLLCSFLYLDALARGKLLCLVVPGIDMSRDSDSGVVRQHPIQPLRHLICAVSHNHLSRMQGVTDTDTASMMKRNPARPRRRIEQRIQNRPVGDGITSILHRFGFAIRRRHRTAVEMIAAADDRRFDLSDEAQMPGSPNFTGAFVGMACQDMAGTAAPADFDWFSYRERGFLSDPFAIA